MKKTDPKFYLDHVLDSMDVESLFEGIANITEFNSQEYFVVQDIGVSSRVMNHWAAKGLMPTKLRFENAKYTFNFVELIWFHIVKELREYGYSLEKIARIRQILTKSIDCAKYFKDLSKKEKDWLIKRAEQICVKNEDEKQVLINTIKEGLNNPEKSSECFFTNILGSLVSEFILYRQDVRVLVDINGAVFPYSETNIEKETLDKQLSDIGFETESYVNISLIKFFRKFVLNKNHFNFLRKNNILNDNEAHILSLVREGKAKSITIRFKDEKPYMLEVTKEKKIQAEARLSEVLLNRGYQDISMKTENGNIVVSNITTKKKLN